MINASLAAAMVVVDDVVAAEADAPVVAPAFHHWRTRLAESFGLCLDL